MSDHDERVRDASFARLKADQAATVAACPSQNQMSLAVFSGLVSTASLAAPLVGQVAIGASGMAIEQATGFNPLETLKEGMKPECRDLYRKPIFVSPPSLNGNG